MNGLGRSDPTSFAGRLFDQAGHIDPPADVAYPSGWADLPAAGHLRTPPAVSGYDAGGYAREMAEVIRERLAGDEAWLAPLGDALGELERLLALDGLHPDVALRAREAISCLAAVWLSEDERDERALRHMS